MAFLSSYLWTLLLFIHFVDFVNCFCLDTTLSFHLKTTRIDKPYYDDFIITNSGSFSGFQLSLKSKPSLVHWKRRSIQIAANSNKEDYRSREDYTQQQWEEMYSILQQYYEIKGHCRVPAEYKTKCGTWLGQWVVKQKQFHRAGTLKAERWERLQELGVSHLTKGEERWEEMYNLLLQFKERKGHLQVRQKHVEDGEKLGIWLKTQRNQNDKGILNAYRAEKLEEYFRTWVPEKPGCGRLPDDELWEEKFNLLLQFKDREGHLDVPKKHREDGQYLGKWISKQRLLHKQGILDDHRERKMNDVGVSWDLTYLLEERWEEMYNLLVQFNDREGHANVPQRHVEDGENLGKWLMMQRDLYKKGILEADREQKLNDIGVAWDLLGDRWAEMYTLLAQFNEREGHSHVPRNHVEHGENLGVWLNDQRKYKKKGIIEVDRQQQLENIGVSWDIIGERWEEMYNLLLQYNEREGHTNVPQGYVEDGETLGVWVKGQREAKKKGVLEADRREKLENLRFAWELQSSIER